MENNLILKTYFKELRKLDLIDSDEQISLAKRAKEGDEKSFDRLVKSNLRFVVTIAKEYQYSNIPLEDLINEGNIGLIKAIYKFESSKNIKFISYAVWWIRQSIIQSIYENGSYVRLPINRININNKVQKAKEELYKKLNREPTIKEVSEHCGLCEDDVVISFDGCKCLIELDGDLFEDSNLQVSDAIESCEYGELKSSINKDAAIYEINKVLSKLNKRENKILRMYFGLDNGEEMNLREIGENIGLTNERVRQIKDFALKKLRTYSNSFKLREFVNQEL